MFIGFLLGVIAYGSIIFQKIHPVNKYFHLSGEALAERFGEDRDEP